MRPRTPIGTVPIVSCARVRANFDAAKGGGIDGKEETKKDIKKGEKEK